MLVVRDEHTGEIGVVTGLKQDGSPNLVNAASKHSRDFLKFDKHSDALENFFMNFFRQYKEPSRFGFYRIAAEGVENVVEVIRDLLKDPNHNKDLLAPHLIDTSKYNSLRNSAEMNNKNQTESQGLSEANTSVKEKKGYHPIDEGAIDWKKMEEHYGVKREVLAESGDLKRMLNYGKSDLLTITPTFGNVAYEIDARLSLRQNEDGSVSMVPHIFRKEPNLKDEFSGHKFTDEDKSRLRSTGNMGRVVDLVDPQTKEHIPSYISIDRSTNEVVALPVSKVRISNKIGNTQLTKEEMGKLRSGQPLVNKQIELANGKTFKATLQVNAEQRGVEFVPRRESMRKGKQRTAPGEDQDGRNYYFKWTDKEGNIRAPQTLGGVELTPDQRFRFQEGKAILVQDMQRDGKGQPYTAYVKYDYEAGKPRYYRGDPDQSQAKQVTPSLESRTQVAVNTDGKTNEATKYSPEPLSKAQVNPKNEKQKQDQKTKRKPTSKQRSL